ncbi:alkene reductase [Thiotrichales bacterium 19S3-7]|nr:alkene reductase [Thiotrichales bacterium 19S3-7]MCF6802055.1 alkene reductase [Thiotrichales bacterium 19S3-11]
MQTNDTANSILFTPIKLGELELKNRIIMAPLTRCRADSETRVPTDIMATYYQQRATAGLIITEATSISPMGVGYPRTPGIWNAAQIEGWKKVTDSVHKADGKILLQLWHVGRISDPIYLDGKLPLAPSAVKPQGHPSLIRPIRDFQTPQAMTQDEIKETIEAYRSAAINAKEAGFDGVEIHGANGYLLDQFLQDSTNKREDDYGGSLENRARLMLEVTDAVVDVWGSSRVGMHLAPRCDAHDMGDSDPLATFTYIAQELGKKKIAFIFARANLGNDNLASKLKDAFAGPYIINQQLSKLEAEAAIELGFADAAAWGQLFIANPDLVERFKHNIKRNVPDSTTFYHEGREGYIDYPFIEDAVL